MVFVKLGGSPAVGPRVGLVPATDVLLFDGNPPGGACGRVSDACMEALLQEIYSVLSKDPVYSAGRFFAESNRHSDQIRSILAAPSTLAEVSSLGRSIQGNQALPPLETQERIVIARGNSGQGQELGIPGLPSQSQSYRPNRET